MLSNDLSVKLYQSVAEENKEREYKHWHASSIAMCPRAHYFARLGIPELVKPSAAKILRWGAGHHLEAAIRPHIEKLYPDVISNNRLTSIKMDLTGEYDNFSPTSKTLIEVKSVDDMAFYDSDGGLALKKKIGLWPNGRNRWAASDEPFLGHQLQNHAYVLLLQESGLEVEEIHYIYVALKGRLVAYKTKVNPDYIENVENRLQALRSAWRIKKPPVCICRPEHELYDSVMQFCPYKTEEGCCNINLVKEQDEGNEIGKGGK